MLLFSRYWTTLIWTRGNLTAPTNEPKWCWCGALLIRSSKPETKKEKPSEMLQQPNNNRNKTESSILSCTDYEPNQSVCLFYTSTILRQVLLNGCGNCSSVMHYSKSSHSIQRPSKSERYVHSFAGCLQVQFVLQFSGLYLKNGRSVKMFGLVVLDWPPQSIIRATQTSTILLSSSVIFRHTMFAY